MSISDLQPTETSDVTLIERTRAGDVEAYGVLHARHVGAAQALARRMSRSGADADDLVSEGFARVLGALQRGKGPDVAFRPYLLSTIRRLAYDRTDRERREAPSEAADEPPPGAIAPSDPVLDGFERETAAAAFASLPERWRMVLWHTEVEGQSPAEVGALLGMNPNAVAALAYRAREGLRQAYLAEHTPRATSGKECERTVARLGAFVRDGLTATRAARVRRHLDDCDECTRAYLELASMNTAMPALVGFAVLGPTGAAYLATTGTASTSAAFTAAITPLVQGGSSAVGLGAGAATGGVGAARAAGRVLRQSRTAVGASAAAGVVAVVAVAAALQGGGSTEPAAGAAGPARTATAPSGADVEGVSTTNSQPLAPTTTLAPTATTATPTTAAPRPATTPPATPATPSAPPAGPPAEAPPVPSELAVEVRTAGLLVRGRPGVVLASVRNEGAGASSAPTVRIELEGASIRAAQLAALTTGTASGWSCESATTTAVVCEGAPLEPGASASLYLPVSLPAGGGGVSARASVDAAHDAGAPGATADATLPVAPSGMAARFATVDRGGVEVIGNTLLSCAPDAPGCAAARAGEPGAGDNGSFEMVPVDVDGDPATSSSSAATLDLGGRGEVMSATLYWSAGLDAGRGGVPAADPSRRDRAVVRTPAGTTVEVTAERVDDEPGGSRYQAVADVTDLVRAAGSGRWTVGDVQLGTGVNTYAGWSLVVAHRDPSLPLRSIVVLDGFASVDGSAAVSFDVGGFVVPAGGSGRAILDVVTYEGDASLTGDQLVVGDVALTDAANPLGNSFNSSSSDRGRARAVGDPSWVNLLGIDIDRFDVADALAPGSTSTTISFTTASDRYYSGAVAFTVDQ